MKEFPISTVGSISQTCATPSQIFKNTLFDSFRLSPEGFFIDCAVVTFFLTEDSVAQFNSLVHRWRGKNIHLLLHSEQTIAIVRAAFYYYAYIAQGRLNEKSKQTVSYRRMYI